MSLKPYKATIGMGEVPNTEDPNLRILEKEEIYKYKQSREENPLLKVYP